MRGAARVGLALLLVVAGATAGSPASAAPEGGVRRILVLSLPTTTWSDLDGRGLSNLDGLLDEAAIADLSLRGVGRRTTAGDGYTTIGAGTRARGASSVDGLAFEVDEVLGPTSVAEIVTERGGNPPADGIVSLATPDLIRINDELPYDATVGALADTLDEAGWSRAVVANADGSASVGVASRSRTAVLALADADGVVPEGEVGEDLLMTDPDAAYGVGLDLDRVVEAVEGSWRDQAVVLVEASDLARADALRATGAEADAVVDYAYRRTDELVGRLLELVDPTRDAVLVVAPQHRAGEPQLTVAALAAPGVDAGYLRSATTRRDGFVTLTDIGPTIVDLAGAEVPETMEGTPFEGVEGGGSPASRRSTLADADEAARFRDRLVAPVSEVVVLTSLGLWVLAVLASGRWRTRRGVGPATSFLALALLGLLPATYLMGALPAERWGIGAWWAIALTMAVGLAFLESRLARRHPLDPLAAGLAVLVGVLVVDVVTGARLQLNTVFGYSPIVGGRFAGLGNLAFGQLAAGGILLAGLLRLRLGGRRGQGAALAVLVGVLVVDGVPFWGSDVGGALTMVVVVGVTAMILAGRRVGVRALVAWAVTSVAVVSALAALDLARPAAERTHLGRLAARIGDQGLDALGTVVGRKLGANLSVLTSSVWALMLPVVLGFLAWMVWRGPTLLAQVRLDLREFLPGLALAAVLGFALNDSGIAVPGIMAGVVNAALAYYVLRAPPPRPQAPAEAPLSSAAGSRA